MYKEILNCLIFSFSKETLLKLIGKEIFEKSEFSSNERKLIRTFLFENNVRPIFLIDNYNLLTACLNSSKKSLRRTAEKIIHFVCKWLPVRTPGASIVLISSNNNSKQHTDDGFLALPFKKRHSFEGPEVLLYLSIYAKSMVVQKLGEGETVKLSCSDFIRTKKGRLSFCDSTGYVPLMMRAALSEITPSLPTTSDYFLDEQYTEFYRKFSEFSRAPESDGGKVSTVSNGRSREQIIADILFRIVIGNFLS